MPIILINQNESSKLKERAYSLQISNIIEKFESALEQIDVLVDGRFELAKKSFDVVFRGSTNQRILDVKASLEKEEAVRIEKYI